MGSKKSSINGSSKGTDTLELKPSSNSSAKSKTKILKTSDITQQLNVNIDQRELLEVLTQVRNGNFSVRMPIDQVGLNGKI